MNAAPPAFLDLKQKLETESFKAAVMGLGYVGLPLAVEYSRAGVNVLGFDLSPEKVASINRGESYIPDVLQEHLRSDVGSGRFAATTDFSRIQEQDTVNICVPTPLRKTKDPDMSFVISAVEQVAKSLRPGMLVVLESTTYPGTTRELVLPLLEKSGLRCGIDFFLCFSPERVDPGNKSFQTSNIPKVVGGITSYCTELGRQLYARCIQTVVPVTCAEVAEIAKLFENSFRLITIGFANEMALMCRRMGINVWEVIDAAATKPFGFMPFYPGPATGGHCIPVDPLYLSWKSQQSGIEAKLIELAATINAQMPQVVVERIQEALNDHYKALRGSKIHLLGLAYKKDIGDTRESPAVDVLYLLSEKGATITYSDSFVPEFMYEGDS